MLLLLPAALMAQSPAGTSAPKLTSAYVKMLGYKDIVLLTDTART